MTTSGVGVGWEDVEDVAAGGAEQVALGSGGDQPESVDMTDPVCGRAGASGWWTTGTGGRACKEHEEARE